MVAPHVHEFWSSVDLTGNQTVLEMATAAELLKIEAGEIGYSRYNDPKTGTKYGRWYAEKTGNAWCGANGIPFCAMGQSWSFDQASQAGPGMSCCGCGDIRNYAKSHNMILSDKKNAKAGDIVLFRWDGKVDSWDSSDHVGMVERFGAVSI